MPVTRTKAGPATPPLAGKPSPFHPGVRLYDTVGDLPVSDSTPTQRHHLSTSSHSDTIDEAQPRRSARKKAAATPSYADDDDIPDVEDLAPRRPSNKKPKVTPLRTRKVVEDDGTLPSAASSSKPARKTNSTTSPKKRKATKMELDVPHPAPAHWKETFEAIVRMRAETVAPVDTMGCHMAGKDESDPMVLNVYSSQ
jgi:endonuclease-3